MIPIVKSGSNMPNTIFSDDFPYVKTSSELKKVIKSCPDHYDEYYIASGCIQERKEMFDSLWKKFSTYADPHFLTQVKTSFHQRTWEMYMGNVLITKEQIIASSPRGVGPDFIVNDNLYLECVACTRGENDSDAVPEIRTGVGTVPVDRITLRVTNSIDEKSRKHQGWLEKNSINESLPFVIAINIADQTYPENPGMPYTIQALFGFQHLQVDLKTGKTSYSHRPWVEKSNGVRIPLHYFNSKNHSSISGILFSNKNVLNHPEKLGDDCIFVNNPFAQNCVSDSFKSLFKSWTASISESGLNLIRNY